MLMERVVHRWRVRLQTKDDKSNEKLCLNAKATQSCHPFSSFLNIILSSNPLLVFLIFLSLLVSSVFWFVSQPFLSYFSASCFTPPFPCISADLNLRQIYNVQLKIVLILDILWFLFLIFKRLELNALHFSLQWGGKNPA